LQQGLQRGASLAKRRNLAPLARTPNQERWWIQPGGQTRLLAISQGDPAARLA